MSLPSKPAGPWHHRVLVGAFCVLLSLLFYWLLGFVVNDLGSWPGPAWEEVERQLLDPKLLARANDLRLELDQVGRSVLEQRQRQAGLRDSTTNSERTMNQLLEIQRLSLQKGLPLSEAESRALDEAKTLFLGNQAKYQALNEQISLLTEQQSSLEALQRDLDKTLTAAREPVRNAYASLLTRHNLKVAALKLAVVLPLLGLAVWMFLKWRGSLYRLPVYGLGLAVLTKAIMVMHEHFPRKYFKYLLVLAALGLVGRILVHLLRMAADPKHDWLLRQFREAYEQFLCPRCRFPIRRGPLKYALWTRRSLSKAAPAMDTPSTPEEPYTCPCCGARLFEECPSCHAIRHSLLPCCTKCGVEKRLA